MFSSYYSKLVNDGLNSAHHHTDSECQARSGSLSDQDLESFQSALNSLDKSLGETGWITPETSSRLQDSADNVDKELKLVTLSLNAERQKTEKEIKLDAQIPAINRALDILYAVFEHGPKGQWKIQRRGRLAIHVYNAQNESLVFYYIDEKRDKIDWVVASDLFNRDEPQPLDKRPPNEWIR